jgi:hypothetical protein
VPAVRTVLGDVPAAKLGRPAKFFTANPARAFSWA